jgi:hypothetical protein
MSAEIAAPALPAADVETLRTRRILRFAIGITLGMALATGIAWPLSFLSPVLVGLLLSSPAPLTLRAGVGFVVIIAVAMGASFVFSVVFLSYPVVFLALIGLLLFRVFYAASGDAHPLSILWMVVGFCVIPLVTLTSALAGAIVAVHITIGAAVAVALALLVQGLIPDPVAPSEAAAPPTPKPTPEASERFRSAAISTLAVWPLLVFFYTFQLTGDLLILIFVAVLAISANMQAGWKGGTALIIANLGGGVITILIYNLLVAVPEFGFFIVLMLLTTLFIGQRRFSDAPTAGLYGSAMNTVLIVIGGVTTSTDEAGAKIYVRIAQIIIAVIYIVVSLGLLESLWKRKAS